MTKSSGLYRRILGYFLCVASIVILIGALFCYGYIRRNELYFSGQIKTNMEGVNERISTYFKRIYDACTLFKLEMNASGYLKDYGSLSLQERYNLVKISQALEHTHIMLDDAAHSIFVYADGEKVYSRSGLQNSNSFFTVFSHYDRYDAGFWLNKLEEGTGIDILAADYLTEQNTGSRVLVKPVIFTWYSSGRLCAMVINLSVDKLCRMYYASAVFAESQYVIYEKGGAIVADPGGVADEIGLTAIGLGDPVRLPAGGRHAINAVDNRTLGWEVLCATPARAFIRTDRFFIMLIALICAAFFMLSIVFSHVFARRIYRPIRSISQAVEDMTGFGAEQEARRVNELDRIYGGVRDIMMKKTELEQKSRRYSTEYVKQSLADIADGKPMPDEAYLHDVLKNEFGFSGAFFGCVSLVLNEPGAERDAQALPGETADALRACLERLGRLFMVRRGNGLTLCVLNTGSDDPGPICDALDGLLSAPLPGASAHILRAGVGSLVPGIEGIRQSFEEANTALMTVGTRQEHCWARFCSPAERERPETGDFDKEALMGAVCSCDIQTIRGAVDRALADGIRPGISYGGARRVVRRVCDVGAEYLRGYGFLS
ncbi:MAG TPA: hypothetical protein PKE04_18030, partial [Clostridia bacterium]|nr:hypothetical protein [Clostridia bacterium]